MYLLAAACLGAVLGSFLNVVILRRGVRDLGGRSACASCARKLAWYDMLPIVSWLALKGRCRQCGSGISMQYPLVEATTALVFVAIFAAPVPFLMQATAALVACLSVVIAAYDIRHTIIPDEWAVFFGLATILSAWAAGAFSVAPVMTLAAGPAAAAIFFGLWTVSQGRWMGLGDAKLALGVGFFLGLVDGVRASILSFMLGAVVSVVLLLLLPQLIHVLRLGSTSSGARAFTMKSEVPFGPFLLAAMWIVWFAAAYGFELPIFSI